MDSRVWLQGPNRDAEPVEAGTGHTTGQGQVEETRVDSRKGQRGNSTVPLSQEVRATDCPLTWGWERGTEGSPQCCNHIMEGWRLPGLFQDVCEELSTRGQEQMRPS